MRGAMSVNANLNGRKLPVIPLKASLRPVTGYYKRRRGYIIYCTIVQPPENAWERIIEYAEYLRAEYNKDVKLHVAVGSNGKYLRYEREDGVPLYIGEDGRIYTCGKSRRFKSKLNATIRFLCESCGYRVKEKKICEWF